MLSTPNPYPLLHIKWLGIYNCNYFFRVKYLTELFTLFFSKKMGIFSNKPMETFVKGQFITEWAHLLLSCGGCCLSLAYHCSVGQYVVCFCFFFGFWTCFTRTSSTWPRSVVCLGWEKNLKCFFRWWLRRCLNVKEPFLHKKCVDREIFQVWSLSLLSVVSVRTVHLIINNLNFYFKKIQREARLHWIPETGSNFWQSFWLRPYSSSRWRV